jgi:hypothetical protein
LLDKDVVVPFDLQWWQLVPDNTANLFPEPNAARPLEEVLEFEQLLDVEVKLALSQEGLELQTEHCNVVALPRLVDLNDVGCFVLLQARCALILDLDAVEDVDDIVGFTGLETVEEGVEQDSEHQHVNLFSSFESIYLCFSLFLGNILLFTECIGHFTKDLFVEVCIVYFLREEYFIGASMFAFNQSVLEVLIGIEREHQKFLAEDVISFLCINQGWQEDVFNDLFDESTNVVSSFIHYEFVPQLLFVVKYINVIVLEFISMFVLPIAAISHQFCIARLPVQLFHNLLEDALGELDVLLLRLEDEAVHALIGTYDVVFQDVYHFIVCDLLAVVFDAFVYFELQHFACDHCYLVDASNVIPDRLEVTKDD